MKVEKALRAVILAFEKKGPEDVEEAIEKAKKVLAKNKSAEAIAIKLTGAAGSILGSLVDDHEDCRVCLSPEGAPHDEGSSCRDLEDAFNEAKDSGFYK